MTNPCVRKAKMDEIPILWDILQEAILKRKEEGSEQWQDGYPNPEVIRKDIEKEAGYVLITNNQVVGYCAVYINDEPEYERIQGNWLSNQDFVVFHRLAIASNQLGKGWAKTIFEFIEDFALNNSTYSVKADTNFDNLAMLHLFEKFGYTYCGEVYFRGSPRKAFEKMLPKKD